MHDKPENCVTIGSLSMLALDYRPFATCYESHEMKLRAIQLILSIFALVRARFIFTFVNYIPFNSHIIMRRKQSNVQCTQCK